MQKSRGTRSGKRDYNFLRLLNFINLGGIGNFHVKMVGMAGLPEKKKSGIAGSEN